MAWMTTQNGGSVSSRRHIPNLYTQIKCIFLKVRGAVASYYAGGHLIIIILILLV